MKPKEEFIFSILIVKCLEGSITDHELEIFNRILKSDPLAIKIFTQQMFINSRISHPNNLNTFKAEESDFETNIEIFESDDNENIQYSIDSNISVRGIDVRDILSEEVQEALDCYNKSENFEMEEEWLELLDYERSAPSVDIPAKKPEPQPLRKVDYSNVVNPRGKGPGKLQLFVTFALAACLMVMVGIAYFMPATVQLPVVGELTDSINAEWDKNLQVPSDDGLMMQTTYMLKRGYASILLNDGVQITLEAPAEVSLMKRGSVELFRGKVYAVVPDSAHGFTILTDGCKVVDLGTEFGVEVDENKNTGVYVTKGSTLLFAGSKDDNIFTKSNLDAGDAKKVYNDGFVNKIPMKEDKFARFIDSKTGVVWNGKTNIAQSENGLVFAESFESPVVDGFAQGSAPEGWVGADEGYGAGRRGLYNANTTNRFSTPYGQQGYVLDYTNSGLTTTETAIKEVLTAGVTYALTFNAAQSGQVGNYRPDENENIEQVEIVNPLKKSESQYRVELVAFEQGDNRSDFRYKQMSGKVLAFASGIVTSNDMSAGDSIIFTAKPDDPNLGKNIAIRLVKSHGCVVYDNIQLRKWNSK